MLYNIKRKVHEHQFFTADPILGQIFEHHIKPHQGLEKTKGQLMCCDAV